MGNIFIHPLALVETDQIGSGTHIWAYTHILPDVTIGSNCNIGEHCFIENGVAVGDNVTIKNSNMLWEGMTIEDGVFIGPHVSFANDMYPRSPRLSQARQRYSTKSWLLAIVIKEGASLGAGSIILPGVEIGEFAMVGAGAVVTKRVPPYALLKGNPGRISGWVCQCGQPLAFDGLDAICASCGLSFENNGEEVHVFGKKKVQKCSQSHS